MTGIYGQSDFKHSSHADLEVHPVLGCHVSVKEQINLGGMKFNLELLFFY